MEPTTLPRAARWKRKPVAMWNRGGGEEAHKFMYCVTGSRYHPLASKMYKAKGVSVPN
jgi:hypothetical protein